MEKKDQEAIGSDPTASRSSIGSSRANPAEILSPNQRSSHNEALSVQDVDVPFDEGSLRSFLLGREVFFETEYLALRRHGDIALVVLRKEPSDKLFSRVVEFSLLATPDQVAWVQSHDTDTANATALALAARSHPRPGVLAYIVEGRYNNVNFIWDPSLIPVKVRDVVPPNPPKLLTMARQVVAVDSDLPPIDLILDAVDIGSLAAEHPAQQYLLQCRGSGIDLGVPTEFLDTRPPGRQDWVLIGCQLSRDMHYHFYGCEPECVETCPLRRADTPRTDLALAKCCLIEQGVDYSVRIAAVGWGASFADIRRAIRLLIGVDDPNTATPASWLESLTNRPDYPKR